MSDDRRSISERIEEAVTNAFAKMHVAKTIFLGKAEMAQYERENASDQIARGRVAIEPTEADSEFRFEFRLLAFSPDEP